MPLIALTSPGGSPGVTTLALALATAWPHPDRSWEPPALPLVVEADPAGGDAATWFGLDGKPGLSTLAAALRSPQSPLATVEILRAFTQACGAVRVVDAPISTSTTLTALRILATAGGPLAVAGSTTTPLLLDLGRWYGATPVAPLVAVADLVVVVTRGGLADLARAAELGAGLGLLGAQRVALVRGDSPYPRRDLATALGMPLLGQVPEHRRLARAPRAAAVRAARRGRWQRAIDHAATSLAHLVTPVAGLRPATAAADHSGPDRPWGLGGIPTSGLPADGVLRGARPTQPRPGSMAAGTTPHRLAGPPPSGPQPAGGHPADTPPAQPHPGGSSPAGPRPRGADSPSDPSSARSQP